MVKVNPESRSKWQRLFPHVRYALSQGYTGQDEARMMLTRRYAIALHSGGRYSEVEKPSRSCLT
jgi:hypothetical protein